MPRITIDISDRSLAALATSRHHFQQHIYTPVPVHRDHIYKQEPAQVITLVDMGDGSYRLGGEFLGQYIDTLAGEVLIQRDTPTSEPVDLTTANFDSVADVDPYNGGANDIN